LEHRANGLRRSQNAEQGLDATRRPRQLTARVTFNSLASPLIPLEDSTLILKDAGLIFKDAISIFKEMEFIFEDARQIFKDS
jgi:hypothetical protein